MLGVGDAICLFLFFEEVIVFSHGECLSFVNFGVNVRACLWCETCFYHNSYWVYMY